MKISLENAVKAISEYLTEEFSKMPKDFNDAWMNAGNSLAERPHCFSV